MLGAQIKQVASRQPVFSLILLKTIPTPFITDINQWIILTKSLTPVQKGIFFVLYNH